ncbi:MAG TPA: hypothetical protein VF530_08495 [Planctomycetota bacterium]
MTEPELPTHAYDADALDRAIEQSLRRRFPVPPSVDTLAARLRPRGGPRVPWLALAAAAAAALVLGAAGWLRSQRAPAGAPLEVVERAPSAESVSFCRLVGPLLEGLPGLGAQQSPDLARLYHDMDACQESAESTACGADDDLAQRLSATYGQPLALRPEAAGRLHGPFGSEEWPTATIVTARSDGETAVLVADRGTTLECCVRMRLAEDSGLQLFTLEVGELFLAEISPHPEPRLLAYFE